MSQTPENKTLKKDRSIDAAYYFLTGRHQAGYCRAVKVKGYSIQRTCVNAARIPPVISLPLTNGLVPQHVALGANRKFALVPATINAKLQLLMMKTAAIFILFITALCSISAAADRDLEKALEKKYRDHILILRHPMHSDLLQFNSASELLTPSAEAPWTVDGAIEIHEVHIAGGKLTLTGDHFLYGFELHGNQVRPYKLKDKNRDKATVEIALDAPLSGMEQADALINHIFASSEADLVNSAPEAWRYFLANEYSKPELVNLPQTAADSDPDDEKPFKPSKEELKKMKPPKPVYTPEPRYSPAAKSLNVRGTMVLSIIIDKTGAVRHPRIIRPLGLGLDEQALNAARTWRFQPATLNGEPVTVQMGIEMNFDLQ